MQPALVLSAYAVAAVHLALIGFLLAGGALALWRPHLVRWHLPVVAGVALVNRIGASCPLTLLENRLRILAGLPPHSDGVVAHYLIRPVHSAGITPDVELLIYAVVVLAVGAPYAELLRRRGGRRDAPLAVRSPART